MDLIILDRYERSRVLRERRESGADRFDEVWDGVYVVSPLPDDEHQDLSLSLGSAFHTAIQLTGSGVVRCGVNVSDRDKGWTKNYRCPDVVAYLQGNPAINKKTHWVGGPDFAVEVISPYDRSRQKLDFYAKVDVRELLLLERKPWSLELYRLAGGRLALVGRSSPDDPRTVASEVVPLSFRLVDGDPRPRVEVIHLDGVQRWSA